MPSSYTRRPWRPIDATRCHALLAALAATGLILGLSACGQSATELSAGASSGDVDDGRVLYDRSCAACHGAGGRGTTQGPPFVHEVYEPSHHPDGAFLLAVRSGVRAHHWGFGDMPPQEGLTDDEVALITAYVRDVQRQAGIE